MVNNMPTSLQKYSEELIDLLMSKYMHSHNKINPRKKTFKEEKSDNKDKSQEKEDIKDEEVQKEAPKEENKG